MNFLFVIFFQFWIWLEIFTALKNGISALNLTTNKWWLTILFMVKSTLGCLNILSIFTKSDDLLFDEDWEGTSLCLGFKEWKWQCLLFVFFNESFSSSTKSHDSKSAAYLGRSLYSLLTLLTRNLLLSELRYWVPCPATFRTSRIIWKISVFSDFSALLLACKMARSLSCRSIKLAVICDKFCCISCGIMLLLIKGDTVEKMMELTNFSCAVFQFSSKLI